MSVTGVVRYGQLFGPNLRLRRTISAELGSNRIDISDTFINDANTPCELAWLLHINFGYPLVDEGSELCHLGVVEPRPEDASRTYFKNSDARIIGGPRGDHVAGGEAVAYVRPQVSNGVATVGIVNRRLSIAVAIRYDPKQFPRCANWQHLGSGEYVTALEPMTGTLAGRESDRKTGDLVTLRPGESKTYRYRIEALAGEAQLKSLRAMNSAGRHPSSGAKRSNRR